MVTYNQLSECDPEQIRAWGAAWTRLWVNRVDHRVDTTRQALSTLGDSWDGEAYQSAARQLSRCASTIADAQAPLRTVDTLLDGLADDLRTAKGMLAVAHYHAARIPATISENGEAIRYTGDDDNPHHWAAIRRRIDAVFADIDSALGFATRADQAATVALRKLRPGYDPTNPGSGYVASGDVPKPGTDPRKVNTWWRGLSPAEQQYLIHERPERVGWLDGIPVPARDQANRVRLADEHDKADSRKTRLQARKAELKAELRRYPAGNPHHNLRRNEIQERLDTVSTELAVVNRSLKGMELIESRLYHQPDKPRTYLIGFEPGSVDDIDGNGEPDDDGRAIVAIGNPDTADHVATYVPGTGADIDGARTDTRRAEVMAKDAHKAARGEHTSVIMWLGYDAPDNVLPDAAYASYAEDATHDLRRFQDGLRVTHEGEPSHNTVIGHSYGSTVIGHTAAGGAIATEELVFVGSPGVGVGGAADLNMPVDHIWSTTAKHDAINDIAGWHGGRDPSDHCFGGRVFDSDPGDPNDREGTHSDYWKDGNTARRNLSHIITGQPDKVTEVPSDPPQRNWPRLGHLPSRTGAPR